MFPNASNNIVVEKCSEITKKLFDNLPYIIIWKTLTGALAAFLYWSLTVGEQFSLKVFKTFIVFIFSEIYLIYQFYELIWKSS